MSNHLLDDDPSFRLLVSLDDVYDIILQLLSVALSVSIVWKKTSSETSMQYQFENKSAESFYIH